MTPTQPDRQAQTQSSLSSSRLSTSHHKGSTPLSSTVSGPWSIALDSVVTRLQASEQRLRAEQAAQVALFAEALDQASPDHFATLRAGRLVHDHAQAELTYRTIRAELACALGLSERTVERRMSHACELATGYPDSHLALRLGEIGLAHTEVITTAGRVIAADLTVSSISRRASYEQAVLVHAKVETSGRLRPIARRLAEQYADQTIDERYAVACEQRRVWVTDHEDGMSDLTAYLPSVEAHAIYDRLTRASKRLIEREARIVPGRAVPVAHAVAEAEAETEVPTLEEIVITEAAPPAELRTRDQVRTDLFSQLLRAKGESFLDPSAGESASTAATASIAGGVQAHVQIFVSDDTLFADTLRLDDEDTADGTNTHTTHTIDVADAVATTAGGDWGAPTSRVPADLSGSGPIDTATARRLAADALVWDLARLHPTTGTVLSVERYRPSEQIRRTLRARDLHCRFPGCRAPAHRCDLDHTVDAAKGGTTSTTNLAHLCRGHHVLKHHGGWHVTHTDDGTLHWRSPTGRAYTDRPPSRVIFERSPANEHPDDRPSGDRRTNARRPDERAPSESPPSASQPGVAHENLPDQPFPF